MKKKIFIISMVVMILFSSIMQPYHEAKAAQFGIALEMLLAMMMSVTTTQSGVNVNVSGWDNTLNDLLQYLHSSHDAGTIEWFADMSSKVILKSGMTLADYLNGGGLIHDLVLWDVNVPIGTIIKMTSSVKNDIAKYICIKNGFTELKAQDINTTKDVLNGVLGNYSMGSQKLNQMVIPWDSIMSYQYVEFVALPSASEYNIICSNQKPTITIIKAGTYSYIYNAVLNIVKGHRFSFQTLNGVMQAVDNGEKDFTYELMSSYLTSAYAITASLFDKLKFNNSELIFNNTYSSTNYIIPAQAERIIVSPTNIDNVGDKDLDTIPITSGLFDKVKDINATNIDQTLPDTDTVTNISSDTISDTQEKTTTDIWDRLKAIPDAIADSMAKVFIPSDAKVAEFVDSAKENMDTKASILLYPAQLVIRFLNGVMTQNEQDFILHWPKIDWMGYTLCQSQDFNLTEYSQQGYFSVIMFWLKKFGDFALIIGFMVFAYNKGQEFFTDGISKEGS